MKRLLTSIVVAAGLVVAMGLPAATVHGSENGWPTEIGVTPTNQIADGCVSATASWTVYLSGGTSGYYTVHVSYGDGYSPPATVTSLTTIPWSYTFQTGGCYNHHYWTQSWSASRAGGGTGYATTHVTSN